ncbi:MAG: glutathione S-transferase family protein [Rubrivivax sp.]
MIRLHYHPGNASLAPHIVLRELGLPFELLLVDRAHDAHKSPAYLKLNPNGLIPVLEDGPLVLYETLAVCLHLVDRHGAGRLLAPPGSDARAQALKWLVWMSNTLQTTLMHYFYPARVLGTAEGEAAQQVRAFAQQSVGTQLQQLDTLLAGHGGPWLLGDEFGLADIYGWMLGRWTRGFDRAPARDYPQLGPWLQRVMARPSVQQVLAAEGLQPPWV